MAYGKPAPAKSPKAASNAKPLPKGETKKGVGPMNVHPHGSGERYMGGNGTQC